MDWLAEMIGNVVEITWEGAPPITFEVQLLEVTALGIVYAHNSYTHFAPWHRVRTVSEPKATPRRRWDVHIEPLAMESER